MENINKINLEQNYREIQEAKEVLKNNGYFVDSLWHVEDVHSKFKCTEEEAKKVLDIAFDNDETYNQIWFSINCAGEDLGLEKVEED